MLVLWTEKRSEGITINYKIADAEVFAGAVKACLRYTPSTINTLWSVYYDLAIIHSPIPGIPSWCPDLRFALRLDTHVPAPLGVDTLENYLPYACYEEMPDLKQIGIKVLRLDHVTRMASRACPSEPTFRPGRRFTQESITWMIEMCHALDIRNNVALKEYLAIGPEEIESLCAAVFSDDNVLNMSRLEFENCLNRQVNKYVFQTASGMIGYSARKPSHGALVVLVPHCSTLQMLSADATKYIGCASVRGLEDNALLDPPPELENKWEMVYLT